MVIEIDDPLDPRLADYRGLRERGKESDEYFIVEGLTTIERLLTSPYPVRSVLLTPATHARLAGRLGAATVYVMSE
ncbi:MAG: TrmH family RNA methyltransferase, partial [Ilumatobacteraceae bacterium]